MTGKKEIHIHIDRKYCKYNTYNEIIYFKMNRSSKIYILIRIIHFVLTYAYDSSLSLPSENI